MSALLLSVALAYPVLVQANDRQPQDKHDSKAAIQKIDGEWTAVYIEMDGKKNEDKSHGKVTIQNNIVTCTQDGKEKIYRLEFGPHHTVRCTEQSGDKAANDQTATGREQASKDNHTHFGVYIAGQDYLCLSFDKGADNRFGRANEARVAGQERETQAQNQQTNEARAAARERETQQGGVERRWEGREPMGSGMVLILRRANVTSAARPK